ncbi:unnamed protein product [Closterium sp. NIES-54]
MASLRVLAFDHEGRPVAFDTWHDDLQLYLLRDIKDSVSLFDHVSGVAPAPLATADGATRSQWLSSDATARLAIRNHLPVAECTHFGQHRTAQALYDAVVAHYSSPATAALGRLLMPYLFPELSALATVADLVTHLRTSDARYRATVPAEFLATNQPPMFITLYFIVSRLPNSLCSVMDHFLSLDPTSLTVDLLEQHLLAAETSAVAVGAARGTPRSPFFEGCSPSPLSPSFASVAAAGISVTEDVGAASTSTKRRSSKGKGGRGGGGGSGGGEGGSGSGGGGSDSSSSVRARPSRPSSSTCGKFHTEHRCFSRLDDAWRAEFGDDFERPRWAELLRSGVAIFDLDFDAIISAMYALSFSAEGDCYRCMPPNPCIAAVALGASASGTPPGKALRTFTLDSGASRCFFHNSTTLTPLHASVSVRLADPSGVPVVASSSTVLPCPAVPSGSLSGLHLPSFSTNLVSTTALQDAMVTTTTPGGQRVSICTCTWTGRHLATFTRRPGSSLYTLATEPPQVAASAQVSMSGQVAASCSCRLRSHQTLLWHHRLGHPSLPRLCGMHSRFLVSGLPSKGDVIDVLIPWIRTVHLQLLERFGMDLSVLRLHSDRGGEFSSDLLRGFCRGEGIVQWFTLPASPHQNGITDRRIGLGMEFTRTSMIHAAAPHFLWLFAVRYAAHQLKLWPRVSLLETSPTLRWTGKVGDASVFLVWGSRAFVRDTSGDKLYARVIPCVFLGFVPDMPGWQFYHPTSRRVLPSKDVTFDESVPFYRLFPYHSAPPPPPPLFLAPRPPPVDPLLGTAPIHVAVGSGASPGAASGGAEPGDVGSEGAGSGGAEPGGAEPGGVELEGAESGGAAPRVAASSGGPAGASLRLSLQQLREWLVRRAHRRSGAPGAGGARDTGAGGAALTTRAGGTGGTAATGPGGARTSGAGAAGTGGVGCAGAGDPTEPGAVGTGGAGAGGPGVGGPGAKGARAARAGVGGTGAGGAGAAGAGVVDPGAGGAGGTVRPRPYFVPLLQQVLGVPSQPPHCLLPLLTRSSPALRPSSVPLRVPLPAPPESSLPKVPDPASDNARAASPTVSRLLATALIDPSFESATASALVAELLDFAAACRLDYTTALVAESVSASPPSVGAAMNAEMASWKSRGTYVDKVPPSRANIVDGMWIFRVKRPSGSPPSFKARYVARGFYQRHGVDYFHTFSPTPKMTTPRAPREWHDTLRTTLAALGFAPSTADPLLFLRTDTSLPPFYVLVYVDDLVFATADTKALTLVNSELQKRHTCTDLGEPRNYLGLHITRDRARRTITLTLSHMVHQVLQRFGFQFSSPQPTPLSTSHSLSAPPLDKSVEPSGPYPELVGCLITSGMGLVLGGRGPVVLTGHANASWVDDSATQRSSHGYTFSLGSGSLSWRTSRSSSVLSSSCEAEIYAGAMDAQELHWLTYLLTDLGEQPRSPPVLYVDNKAMIALCQEHRLEHRTKHIALRYFLAQELQQRGQLRLAYVATRANTADVFTKALPPGDHQRFATMLGVVPTLPHLLTA